MQQQDLQKVHRAQVDCARVGCVVYAGDDHARIRHVRVGCARG